MMRLQCVICVMLGVTGQYVVASEMASDKPVRRTAIVAGSAALADPMTNGFRTPPPETRPWCYWYWISGNISKEGVTRDLEAMARVGIGEALIGNVVDESTPLGDVQLFSDHWWDILQHAVREGGRLGVNIGLFNGPGWSQSGGPWISPKQAMRYVVSSELRVHGPAEFQETLPAPKTPFEDIAVIAFPAPAADADNLTAHRPRIVCSPNVELAERLVDGKTDTGLPFPDNLTANGNCLTVDIELAEPLSVRSAAVYPAEGNFLVQCELLAADEQGTFRRVRDFQLDRRGPALEHKVNVGPMINGPAVVSFAPVKSRRFRLILSGIQGEGGLTEIKLSGAARLDRFVEKQLGKMYPQPLPLWNAYLWPPSPEPESSSLAIAADSVINISDKLSPDGTLRWNVPEGDWVVLRCGMTPTGATNHPTTIEGQGLEVDKMNRGAIEQHFNAMVGKLLERMPAADRKALRHVVIDSYEVGSENWTNGFDQNFRQTFGYDPTPWLPVLTGRIVGSAKQSDRFLWDLRRLVANRIARDYVGGLRDVCQRHGLRLWLENYGHWGFPAEFLQYGGQTDDLGGEFWVGGDLSGIELRAASSAAHIYGKPVVSAEAFTSARSFLDSPASVKSLGDWAYCQGINHFVLHVYIHQPWDDRRPGVNAWFGTEFNRHNTWFEQSKGWIDYLRRCHWLLQQGHHVADVAYFIGEDTPKMTGIRQPELPKGYDFDFINADVLLDLAAVKDGRIVLPSGASYGVLVLPPQETMRPELLAKIRELVADGASVLGPAPQRSPSLQGYPHCDDEVCRLAAEIWADCDGQWSTERSYGRGRVFCGIDLAEAIKRLGVAPAVVVPDDVLWTQRRIADGDIFFISNQRAEPRLIDASFRISGRNAEFWQAQSGSIETTAWLSSEQNRTRVPIALDPHGSVFVVFRSPVSGPTIVRVQKDGQQLAADGKLCPIQISRKKNGLLRAAVGQPGVYSFLRADNREFLIDALAIPAPLSVVGPWQLKFPPAAGTPASVVLKELKPWQESNDDAIRYFSGTAVYETTFDLPPSLFDKNRRPENLRSLTNRSAVNKLASPAGTAEYATELGSLAASESIRLDLGHVETVAEVRVNGKNVGTLWKPPYSVDITDAVVPGKNVVQIAVTNNWWNRLVGDEKLLPERRKTYTSAKSVAPRRDLLPSGLLGPVQIVPMQLFLLDDGKR